MINAFIFEDQRTMQIICGVNDSNLSYLEDLMSCNFSVRGNRIEYDLNEEKSQILTTLLQRLSRLCNISDNISENEILMEYKALTDKNLSDESSAYERTHITIGTKAVYPKGKIQEKYIQSMKENQITFATGPAGTGKTYLAVSYCLGELLSGRKQKIILTRPVVEAGESLGFLPGDLTQKLNPYLRPLFDSMEATLSPSTINRLIESGSIEIAPLAYMRGRSMHNACIILDEAQNSTSSQMKMFLTRIGENATAIITGDITQVDLPSSQKSGLVEARKILGDIEGISFIEFSAKDTVRSRIVQRIINAYEKG